MLNTKKVNLLTWLMKSNNLLTPKYKPQTGRNGEKVNVDVSQVEFEKWVKSTLTEKELDDLIDEMRRLDGGYQEDFEDIMIHLDQLGFNQGDCGDCGELHDPYNCPKL